MEKNKKHIDHFFGEKLGKYREAPPADVWDTLDKQLDTLQPPASVPGTPYRWLLHAGIVSLIAVLGVSLYHKIEGNGSGTGAAETVVTNTVRTDGNSTAITATQPAEAQGANATDPIAGQAGANTADAVSAGSNSNMDAGHEQGASNADVSSSNATTTAAVSHMANAGNSGARHIAYNGTASNHDVPASKSIAKQLAAGGNGQIAETTIAAEPAVTRNGPATVIPRSQRNNHRNTANMAVSAQSISANTFNRTTSVLGREPEQDNAANTTTGTYQAGGSNTATTEPAKAQLPGTLKKDAVADPKKALAAAELAKMKADAAGFRRIEAGVKAGYERGADNLSATKFVLSPYVQYNFNKRIAIMTQPAIKVASLADRNVGNTKSYLKVNNDGQVKKGNSVIVDSVFIGAGYEYLYATSYNYSQTHDSMSKTRKTGGSYTEFELPLLLKYQLTPKLAIYGGPKISYSKLPAITEQTTTVQGIKVSVDKVTDKQATPAPEAVGAVIHYNGNLISDYVQPGYVNTSKGTVNAGYMVGVSYEYNKKWLFDALMQQTPAAKNIKDGYDYNKPLSAPYFRVSVGYKLTK